jgi:hypothetical protein
VDGRNPAPVDRWFIPLFIGFQHVSSILLVVQDFFHPQYDVVVGKLMEVSMSCKKTNVSCSKPTCSGA